MVNLIDKNQLHIHCEIIITRYNRLIRKFIMAGTFICIRISIKNENA